MGLSKKYCREHFSDLVREYRISHDTCAICGIPEHATWHRRFPSGLQLAHLMAGVNRKDHPANIAMLCARCHGHQHGSGKRFNGEELPTIDLGVLLAAKQRLGELDVEMLHLLTDYQPDWFLEQVTEIPDFYLRESATWNN